jgi:hypothetical protein
MRSVDLSNKDQKYHKWYAFVRKDITRCDYKRSKKLKNGGERIDETHGWWVRINWMGRKYQKMFHDHHSSGPQESLWRAQQWREKEYQRIGKPYTHKVLQTINNSELGQGLRHNPKWKQVIKRKGKIFIYYRDVIQVTWPKGNGKHGASSVSVTKYGYKKAVSKARKILSKKYEEFYGVEVI